LRILDPYTLADIAYVDETGVLVLDSELRAR
jgi:hypothetical protein